MIPHDIFQSLIAGVLVGCAAGAVLLLHGRVAGISGMLATSILGGSSERSWMITFLVGLVTGGALLAWLDPAAIPQGAVTSSLPLFLAAGFLVGFGARVGGGCTSGHGLCGLGLLSLRSAIAAGLFVLAGALSVWASRVWLGGGL